MTRMCLRQRRLVLLAWLILAVAGAATASSTVGCLTHTFATPGYTTNQQLLKTFGIDGNEQPSIGVLTLGTDRGVRVPVRVLGVEIFVDAVIVRTLLVPALVAIMGRWNWWLPSGLATMLRVPVPEQGGLPAEARQSVGA